MKKTTTIFLSLVLMFAIGGCAGGGFKKTKSGNISCIGFIKNVRKVAELMPNRQFYLHNRQVLLPLRPN